MLSALVTDGALWFSIPALLGTGYLLVSLILDQTTGGDLDFDLDIDTPDAGVGHTAHVRILSLQTIAAFCVGAGWMGLAAMRLVGLGLTESAFVAIGSGVGIAWLFIVLMRWLFALQSSGNIVLTDAVDRAGTVTVLVPPAGQGRGRVAVVIGRRRREFDAMQREGSEPLRMGASVRVAAADPSSNALIVGPD
jgi:hypothetical protein